MHPPFPDSSLGGHASMSSATPGLPLGATAIVYCEGQFGEQDGKTANGLVRHSEKYEILSVIDSSRAGADTGLFLDGTANGIPILASLGEAILHAGRVPDYLICGLAPADGLLSPAQRVVLLDGIDRGMHVINGLHEFLNDDPEFVAAALLADVLITDVRRPKEKKDLHLFSGRIFDVTCPRIAVLGTDGAIGNEEQLFATISKGLGRSRVFMVGIGSALVMVMAKGLYDDNSAARLAANVITGIGFLGAGVIIRHEDRVHELTTAASLWFVAMIGLVAGARLYVLATGATVMGVLVLSVLRWLTRGARSDRSAVRRISAAERDDQA